MSAERGVTSRSTEGASAKLKKQATFVATPLSSNVRVNERATSCVTPIAAKTIVKRTSSPGSFACRVIWAARRLCGMPLPEKMGSFCPRTSVFIPSMAEMPVWMKSRG